MTKRERTRKKKRKYRPPSPCPVCGERGTIHSLSRNYEYGIHDKGHDDTTTCIHATSKMSGNTKEDVAYCVCKGVTGKRVSIYLTWQEAASDGIHLFRASVAELEKIMKDVD